jgi:transposase-like protein
MTKNIQTAKLNAAIDMLIESDADLSNVLGKEGLIKQLSKCILERALEGEMQSHLGYEHYNRSDIDNARNGSYQKNLITNNGQIELNVPRDRKGQFEPIIVKKKQSRIDGLDEKIISLYAKGMSISDIKIQLEELYGAEVSESLISRITDDVIDEVKSWQGRALESVYPIVFFDCLVVKVRQDKRIINKSVYIACCAPGILVHPCARLEVHYILTFLYHIVILHFKFWRKVFSVRITL